MTNHRALTYSFFTVAIALSMAAPAAAQSECQPDDLFCAELRIGPGRAGVRVGPADHPPPPPPPEPPTVYVEPAPPPPPPPQPPTVIVEQAPQRQPQVVQVRPARQHRIEIRRERIELRRERHELRRQQRANRFPYSAVGPHFSVGGLFGDQLAMMGGGTALRIRPIPHLALDVGAGFYYGNDYNGLDRAEVPLTLDALFFFNPRHRFQFYALVGVGGSWSHAEGRNRHTRLDVDRDYGHLGAQAGLGLEWRISRVFALNFDVRAFIRQRVDGAETPEFMEPNRRGEWQSTDTSAGLLGQLGMTFYFGR